MKVGLWRRITRTFKANSKKREREGENEGREESGYEGGSGEERREERMRGQRMMRQKMRDEIVRRVRDWLVEEGIYKDRVTDENADHHFIAEVPPSSGQLIDIIFPKSREDLVAIVSGVKLSDEHHARLMSLKAEKRDEILWKMRFDLLFLPTGFQILPSAENPQIFQFVRELYFDGLNKNLFIEAVNQVYRCKLFVIWTMQRLFGNNAASVSASAHDSMFL
ncbi:Protein of unknown function DUF2299 [Ferroglobus placidus DSM 10642]|uniref:DUF2299 domain-containing protein n=1 Tax=Ferroglobus placidus (strain DSM 10642 / AEDII12DO) TaxID=589924 RepID=D3S3C1_FERPA|nr:DUF2299 family protein [Ferroglobus placidus]ADC64754.1 Protein of unknown function DUF2299 [Ferroglobus placidus DSM 10642]